MRARKASLDFLRLRNAVGIAFPPCKRYPFPESSPHFNDRTGSDTGDEVVARQGVPVSDLRLRGRPRRRRSRSQGAVRGETSRPGSGGAYYRSPRVLTLREPSAQEVPSRQTALLDAEPPGDGRPQVREAPPDAEVSGISPAGYQERDALAGVVRPRVGRVVAVVGGEDKKVVICESFEQLGHPIVEAPEVLGHALGVAAVAVLGVEVHEVGEDEAALHPAQSFKDRVHLGRIVGLGGEVFGG